jgi:DNA-directed RNA polymerase beta subunit
MVEDFIMSRGVIGPYVAKTRQPTKGRKNDGASLRLGYMEVDALKSHGAATNLVELFREHSDGFANCFVSELSGLQCGGNDKLRKYFDGINNHNKISKVYKPWCKIMEEFILMMAGIAPRSILENEYGKY